MMRRLAAVFTAAALTAGLALTATPAKALSFYEMQVASNHSWCITSYNGTPGYPVQAGDPVFEYLCEGKPNQGWAAGSYGGGYYTFEYQLIDANHQSLCLADPNDSGSDGTQYELWYCENIPAEKFAGTHYADGAIWQEAGHGETIANSGGILQDWNPIITWHFVANAYYEKWVPF